MRRKSQYLNRFTLPGASALIIGFFLVFSPCNLKYLTQLSMSLFKLIGAVSIGALIIVLQHIQNRSNIHLGLLAFKKPIWNVMQFLF
jgi:hypothetical protein